MVLYVIPLFPQRRTTILSQITFNFIIKYCKMYYERFYWKLCFLIYVYFYLLKYCSIYIYKPELVYILTYYVLALLTISNLSRITNLRFIVCYCCRFPLYIKYVSLIKNTINVTVLQRNGNYLLFHLTLF